MVNVPVDEAIFPRKTGGIFCGYLPLDSHG